MSLFRYAFPLQHGQQYYCMNVLKCHRIVLSKIQLHNTTITASKLSYFLVFFVWPTMAPTSLLQESDRCSRWWSSSVPCVSRRHDALILECLKPRTECLEDAAFLLPLRQSAGCRLAYILQWCYDNHSHGFPTSDHWETARYSAQEYHTVSWSLYWQFSLMLALYLVKQ